ncbi:MAG: mechanosensitive ion channel [Burkholderiales bacterium]|nr:mechanosensitive ion channel [Burkholderiales bacterium]
MSAEWIARAEPWLVPALSSAVAAALALVGARIGIALLRRLARRKPLVGPFVSAAASPGTALAALLAASSVLQAAPNSLYGIGALRHLATLALIAAATWLAMRLAAAIADAVALRFPANVADNLEARRIQTQTRVLTRTLASLAAVVGVSFALLTFPDVRTLGAGLLASAGVIGLTVGIAAKPVLGNLLAGLQIAFTQPIRLDDVVIVEGEWGRIEEIGHAFVVVALWDQRRLVVPLQYFIEKPFQNWTRSSSQILGTVFLWVDYGAPLEALRAELRRVCEASADWDRRVCLIQVTDASERSMQLRVLVSSTDAGRAWNLRCAVREALIAYLRNTHPEFLPRLRAEIGTAGA